MTSSYASQVVAGAGATKPFRDSVDAKMASDFASGTGNYRQNVKFPDDFPTYQNLAAPRDADNDGMADDWESANGEPMAMAVASSISVIVELVWTRVLGMIAVLLKVGFARLLGGFVARAARPCGRARSISSR